VPAVVAHVQRHLHRRPIILQHVLLDEELLHGRQHGQGKEALQLQEERMQPFPRTVPQVSKTPNMNPRLVDLAVGIHEAFIGVPKLHPEGNVAFLPYGSVREGFQEELVLQMQCK
jgi:hypothetical protein